MAGRRPFEPTEEERQTVEAMKAYGIPPEDICQVIRRPRHVDGGALKPISPTTLRKHFGPELDCGEVKAISKVANALFQTAIDRKHKGHVVAARFFLQCRAGWSPRQRIDARFELGDISEATPAELEVIERFLQRQAARHSPANDRDAA